MKEERSFRHKTASHWKIHLKERNLDWKRPQTDASYNKSGQWWLHGDIFSRNHWPSRHIQRMLTGLFMGDPANNIWNLLDSSLISSTPLTHTLHTRRPAGRTDKPDKTSDRPVRKFQNNDRALEPNGYTRKSSGRSIRTHQSLQGAESHLHETSQTAVTPLFTGLSHFPHPSAHLLLPPLPSPSLPHT